MKSMEAVTPRSDSQTSLLASVPPVSGTDSSSELRSFIRSSSAALRWGSTTKNWLTVL
ncbi:hypothetical protein D3C87_1987200 [compost metagenome]